MLLLSKIAEKLPDNYAYIRDQKFSRAIWDGINNDSYLGKYYTLISKEILPGTRNDTKTLFDILDIKIYKRSNHALMTIGLRISETELLGFYTNYDLHSDIDMDSINTDEIKILKLLNIGELFRQYKNGKREFHSFKLIEDEDKNKKIYYFLENSDIHLTGSSFNNIHFTGISLRGAIFKNCVFKNCSFGKNDLKVVDFSFSVFDNINMVSAYIYAANFSHAFLKNTNFSGSYLAHADFNNAKLINCIFCNSDLIEATFEKANLKNIDFSNSDIRGINLTNSYLSYSNFHNTLFFPDDGPIGITGYVKIPDVSNCKVKCNGLKLIDVKGLETKLNFFHKNGAKLSKSQIKQIEYAEIFTGDYFLGDGFHNANLSIKPDGTFNWSYHGDVGGFERKITGKIFFEDNRLELLPDVDATFMGRDLNLVIIFWDDRIYLIPEHRLPIFVSAINLRDEPRNQVIGIFYLRENDWIKPVQNRPLLPIPYNASIFDKPKVGRIISITGNDEAWTNLGSNDGILKNMIFFALEPRICPVFVTLVEEKKSKIKSLRGDELLKDQEIAVNFTEDDSYISFAGYFGLHFEGRIFRNE